MVMEELKVRGKKNFYKRERTITETIEKNEKKSVSNALQVV